MYLFEDCSETATKYLSQKLTENPIHSIETQIESIRNKRLSEKGNAYNLGFNLYNNCKEELSIVGSVLNVSSMEYKMLADNLAKEMLQCGIDYFNEWQDSKNPSRESLGLLRLAQSIATSLQTKERIKENITGIENYADTARIKEDSDFILKELLAFKDYNNSVANAKTLVVSCKPRLQKIKSNIGADNELYISLSSFVLNAAQGMLVAVVNKAQENFNKFNSLSTSSLILTIEQALEVSEILGTLDVNLEQRERYEKNHETLKSLVKQLVYSSIIRTQMSSSNSSPRPSVVTKTQEELERARKQVKREEEDQGVKWWIVVLIHFIGGFVVAIANADYNPLLYFFFGFLGTISGWFIGINFLLYWIINSIYKAIKNN